MFAWCRGCALGGFFLIPTVLAMTFAAMTATAEQTLHVPSGQRVDLNEVLLDDSMGELWVRFRFVAPRIGKVSGSISFDVAVYDIDHLCNEFAVPYLVEYALEPERVIVSLSDRALEFGATNHDATQFFGAYRLESARCIWEEF